MNGQNNRLIGETNPPGQKPPRLQSPSLRPYVGRLGSEPHLEGRIGSGMRFFQKLRPSSVLRLLTFLRPGGRLSWRLTS